MKCSNPDMKKLISLYQLGLLPDDKKDRAEAHLLECEACIKELYQLDPAMEMLDTKPELFLKELENRQPAGSKLRRYFHRIITGFQSFITAWQRHRIMGIAVPAAAVIALVLYIKLSGPELYADLAIIEKAPHEMLTFKSPENLTPNQKLFKTALELYHENKYTENSD